MSINPQRAALVVVYWWGAVWMALGVGELVGAPAVLICLGAALMLYALVGRVMMGVLP